MWTSRVWPSRCTRPIRLLQAHGVPGQIEVDHWLQNWKLSPSPPDSVLTRNWASCETGGGPHLLFCPGEAAVEAKVRITSLFQPVAGCISCDALYSVKMMALSWELGKQGVPKHQHLLFCFTFARSLSRVAAALQIGRGRPAHASFPVLRPRREER